MSKKAALDSLRLDIAEKLCEIEDLCAERKIPMPCLTLIARDPAKPEMYVVVSNETPDGMRAAFDTATRALEGRP